MQVKIPHQFKNTEAAVAQVKKALQEAKPALTQTPSRGRPQMAGQATIEREEWQDHTLHFAFTAQGNHISGHLAVGENEFDLYAKLPLMFKLFEGKIEKMIKEQVAQLGAQKQ